MSQYPHRSRTEWVTRMLAWNPRLPLLLFSTVVLSCITFGALVSREGLLFLAMSLLLGWAGTLALKDLQAFLRHELHYLPNRHRGGPGDDLSVADPIAGLLEEIEFKVTRLKDIRERHGDGVADKCEELLRQQEYLSARGEEP